jgi:hypothetical protein
MKQQVDVFIQQNKSQIEMFKQQQEAPQQEAMQPEEEVTVATGDAQ